MLVEEEVRRGEDDLRWNENPNNSIPKRYSMREREGYDDGMKSSSFRIIHSSHQLTSPYLFCTL